LTIHLVVPCGHWTRPMAEVRQGGASEAAAAQAPPAAAAGDPPPTAATSAVTPYGVPVGVAPAAGQAGAPLPGAPAAGGAPPPTVWQGPYLDQASGRYYYHNPYTQQSSWAQAHPDPAAMAAYGMADPNVAAAYGMPAMMPVPGYHMMPMPYGYPYMAGALTAAYSGAVGGATPEPSKDGAGGGDGRSECGDFKRGKCDRGDSCRYEHVKPSQECRDFRSGRCARGANCKFLHDGDLAHIVEKKLERDGGNDGDEKQRKRSRSR